MAKCSWCPAEIEWALSATTGKRMPLDLGNNPDGNLRGIGFDKGTLIVKVVEQGDPSNRMPHFATCTGRKSKP